MSASQILLAYFGYPTGAVWSNLIASAICALLVWWRLRARQVRQHVEQMALIAKLHGAHMEQAEAHHRDQMALLRKQHSQLSDQVAAAPQTVAAPAPLAAEAEKITPEVVKAIRRQQRAAKPGGAM